MRGKKSSDLFRLRDARLGVLRSEIRGFLGFLEEKYEDMELAEVGFERMGSVVAVVSDGCDGRGRCLFMSVILRRISDCWVLKFGPQLQVLKHWRAIAHKLSYVMNDDNRILPFTIID